MSPATTVTVEPFGHTPEGDEIQRFTIKNQNAMTAQVINYGAILTALSVPDRDGKIGEITLGFDSLDGYLGHHPHFGSTIGRVGNRIAKGHFILNGHEHHLHINNGLNSLHGGKIGFNKVVWNGEPVESGVQFTRRSPDGEENYPGNLDVTVTYSLSDDNSLQIDYAAVTDRETLVNLTNHTYFNLAGSGNILNHQIQINADKYTVNDDTLIPTGEIAPVHGSPLDFTSPHTIGERIEQIPTPPGGYDHNFVLNKPEGKASLTLMARVYEPITGRTMEAFTTEPGVQFYTANFLDGSLK